MKRTQKTIEKEFSLEGIGLHTGEQVKVLFKPAQEDSGINFVRVDLPGRPVIKAEFPNVLVDHCVPRCTSLSQGQAVIHTVEHVMAVLLGLEIDNITIEINGNELPGLDGSGLEFLNAVQQAGIKELSAPRTYFEIKEPILVEKNGASISIVPASDFSISYVLDYGQSFLSPQVFSSIVNADTFQRDIAPCRTFCLENEAEELRKAGLGMGANYHNTLVITENGIKDNQTKFDNEFARHKVLDFLGDLYLLGMPIKGHVVAFKSGHKLNRELLKKIFEQREKYEFKTAKTPYAVDDTAQLDINGIVKILPHRYPFLFVDRIIDLDKGKKAVGIKNVTINDNFFQGHFPTRPIMPGVIMIEAMAQVGGIAVLSHPQNQGKVAFFMGANNVKFRKVVLPGDQLVMEAEVLRNKTKIAQIHAKAKVDGQVVAEADMVFSFTEASFID